jgi:hypothetical protein
LRNKDAAAVEEEKGKALVPVHEADDGGRFADVKSF